MSTAKLTGGLVINEDGPVTVIADGKSSQAPDGKLPAASILDSKGIVLNKEDRVSVEKDGSQDHPAGPARHPRRGDPYGNGAVLPRRPSSTPRSPRGRPSSGRKARTGEIQRVFDVTYVDGVPESETLISETTTVIAIDQIIAVGRRRIWTRRTIRAMVRPTPAAIRRPQPETDAPSTQQPSDTTGGSSAGSAAGPARDHPRADRPPDRIRPPGARRRRLPPAAPAAVRVATPASPEAIPADPTQGRLWHPTVAQAQTYAAGAAAQYGWTGAEWDALVWLWNHESSWLWYADNPGSRRLRHPAGPARFQDGARLAGRRRGADRLGG